LEDVANAIKVNAENLSMLPRHLQLAVINEMMEEHCPELALLQVFSRKRRKGRKHHSLWVEDLVKDRTVYPTLVIPLGCDGSVGHAVAVVDDLIFDSTQTKAMRLTKGSLDWICGKTGIQGIMEAIRFHGSKNTKKRYERKCLKTNW
jgi:hypothetical protein